jgi:response regulator RpfG family c-di-GMP phosphodiesterase
MESTEATPRKRHVLIVEDDLELAESYKQLLEARDYDVSTAPNGVLALRHILRREVDAIVCDLKMPEQSGDLFYATVERVKPHLRRRFIFITGFADKPQFRPFVDKVESPVLRKPLAIEQLLAELEKLLIQTQ